MTHRVRPPALAGSFMLADPNDLAHEVDRLLASGQCPATPTRSRPKVLIVPHAGHMYSGRTAASAYVSLAPADHIRRVVILGPAHRVAFKGIALPDVDAFATPLGEVPLDPLGIRAVADIPSVSIRSDVHELEHCLEVQLPFLQRMLSRFTWLPIVVGDTAIDRVIEVIDRLWGGPDVLFVISTDLSHFHPYEEAQRIDRLSCAQIKRLDGSLTHQQACGATPLNAMLNVARQRGLRVEPIDRCNSGDTGAASAEGRTRVVGYASFALYEPDDAPDAPPPLNASQGERLVRLARSALNETIAVPIGPPVSEDDLQTQGASFVTLTRQGQLRGCIGSLRAHRTLAADVRANVIAAALQDPRFPKVTTLEAPLLRIEVSVLGERIPLSFANEAHALWQLRPGVHGVIFECVHNHRTWHSTFLPQVWEQIPDPVEFIAQLKIKAGLTADFWSDQIRLSVYQVQKFLE